MITDAYTKAILTVIAACLVWMCLNSITPVTQAQAKLPEPTPVILVDAKGVPITTVPSVGHGGGGAAAPAGRSVAEPTQRAAPTAVDTAALL